MGKSIHVPCQTHLRNGVETLKFQPHFQVHIPPHNLLTPTSLSNMGWDVGNLFSKNSKRERKILLKRLITMSMSWKHPLRQLARRTAFILPPKSPWSFSRLATMVRSVLMNYIKERIFFTENRTSCTSCWHIAFDRHEFSGKIFHRRKKTEEKFPLFRINCYFCHVLLVIGLI